MGQPRRGLWAGGQPGAEQARLSEHPGTRVVKGSGRTAENKVVLNFFNLLF